MEKTSKGVFFFEIKNKFGNIENMFLVCSVLIYRELEKWLSRLAHAQKFKGSNPLFATKLPIGGAQKCTRVKMKD